MIKPQYGTIRLTAIALALTTAAAQAQTSPAGQQSPAQPTIRENRVIKTPLGKGGEAQDRNRNEVSGETLNSVLGSAEDLNAIRDNYMRRLEGDGCAPDVAIRVAELRSRLSKEGSAGRQEGTQSSADLEGAMVVLAAEWTSKTFADSSEAAATSTATRETQRARMLDAVLVSRDAPAASGSQSEDPNQLRNELDRLLATCRSAKK